MMGLTPRESECLRAIKRLTIDGVPPTYAELGEALGLASKSNVHRLLHALARRGAITLIPDAKRSIRVLDDFEGLERHTTLHLAAMRQRIDAILRSRAS
jgi:repressor LexA